MRVPVRALTLGSLLAVALSLTAVGTDGSTTGDSSDAPRSAQRPPLVGDPLPVPPPDARATRRPATAAPLTGVELTADQRAQLDDRPAVIVKVPNNELAHPHTGLEHADVVYEQETEGGTTRFAAVFHSVLPEVVGNIRSARPVDVALVSPYDGVFVFAGARGEVLEMIEEAELVTVGAGGPGYFTDPARTAPHHLYSRPEEALAERDAPPPPVKPWSFDERPPPGGRSLEGALRILMSPIAATSWDWDEQDRVFRRLQNDQPHLVTGPDRIGAVNVAILDVAVTGRDSHGAPVYDLEGDGDAWLLRDGRAFEIGWSKDGDEDHLAFVDGVHAAVLAPGPTWVVLTYDGVLDGLEEQLGPPVGVPRPGEHDLRHR